MANNFPEPEAQLQKKSAHETGVLPYLRNDTCTPVIDISESFSAISDQYHIAYEPYMQCCMQRIHQHINDWRNAAVYIFLDQHTANHCQCHIALCRCLYRNRNRRCICNSSSEHYADTTYGVVHYHYFANKFFVLCCLHRLRNCNCQRREWTIHLQLGSFRRNITDAQWCMSRNVHDHGHGCKWLLCYANSYDHAATSADRQCRERYHDLLRCKHNTFRDQQRRNGLIHISMEWTE